MKTSIQRSAVSFQPKEIGSSGNLGIGSSESQNSLEPTPIWDGLGCSGIPGEGWVIWSSRHRVIGKPNPTAEGGRPPQPRKTGADLGTPGCHMGIVPHAHRQTYAKLGWSGVQWDTQGGGRRSPESPKSGNRRDRKANPPPRAAVPHVTC